MSKFTWRDVPGWFDFQDIYDQAVSEAQDGDSLVEVGCFLGRSTLYMAERIRESGKRLRFYAVDRFDHSDWVGALKRHPVIDGPSTLAGYEHLAHLPAFRCCLERSGLAGYITVLPGASIVVAGAFDPASLRFCFIDADHTYSGITADLAAWAPKVMPGGILAGHDYIDEWPGVIQAVNETYGPAKWDGLSAEAREETKRLRMVDLAASRTSWRVRLAA